jgi:hypothetical protein
LVFGLLFLTNKSFMKRLLLCLGLVLFLYNTAISQTTLSPGDIVISVYNEDGDDDFAFVLLTDIASGTVIKFTDDGWLPEAGEFRDSEGEVTWTATSDLPKGTEIIIYAPGDLGSGPGISTNFGTAVESDNSFSIAASSGDQIIAFQGDKATSPTPIYMFDSSTSGLETLDADVSANEDSGLPTGLTSGTTAYVVGSATQDNFQYNCPSISDATAANILASFMNGSNYTSSTTTTYAPVGCNYRDAEITGNEGWRMLSFPITSGVVSDISDDTAIQGVTGGANASDDSNFLTYDDSGTFETPTNLSTAIGDGYGFLTYFYDNTTAGSSTLPIGLDVSGSEPSSDVTLNLNKTTLESGSYYTMVGNPFASNFNTNSMTVDAGAIQNNIAFWDDGAGSYSTQDRTASSGYIVAPWQGFWVEVASGNAATQLTMPTSGKSTSSPTGVFFSKRSELRADLNFELSSEDSFDKAIRLSFREDAIPGYDLDDATKFTPLLENYSTLSFVGEIDGNDKLQSVFSLPFELNEEVTIPLHHESVGIDGDFTLSWNSMTDLPEDLTITLHDYLTGISTNLRTSDNYLFSAEQTNVTKTRTILVPEVASVTDESNFRFALIVTPGNAVSSEQEEKVETFALEQNFPNPFNPSTNIRYTVDQSGPVRLAIYNMLGQQVAELVNQSQNAGTYQVTWNASGSASGVYFYRLESAGQSLTRQMTLIK